MQNKKIMLITMFFVLLSAGCATQKSTVTQINNMKTLKDIKTVEIALFTCSNPVIAQNIRNKIIESLLTHYSISVGGDADAEIVGAIDLVKNHDLASKEIGEDEDIVSEVNAQIMINREIVTSVNVTQDNPGVPDSSEVIGKKIGAKIREILLQGQ